MASTYPGTLDSFATSRANTDVTDTTHPADHNNANDAINKIETELGTHPSLASADVATLHTAMMNRWMPITDGHVNLAAAAAGTYPSHRDATTNLLIGAASPAGYAVQFMYLNPADYAITGYTVQYRVVASFSQNAVANAGTSVMTAGLYPYVGAGATTTWLATLGTVVSGSTAALTGGAASSESRVISTSFTAPAADTYALAVVVSVATTAGSTRINTRLEYRYV